MSSVYEDDWEEDFEEEPYESIRAVLAPEYDDLSAEEIEALLAEAGIDANDLEFSLKNAFKKVGHFAQKAAPTILPIVGTVAGTALGRPAGAMLGGALGRVAGGAIGAAGSRGAHRQAPRARQAPTRHPTRVRRGRTGGSPTAAQLLQAIQRPEVLQGLLAMALGSSGKRNTRIGAQSVPSGAIANLLGVLANRATEEYNAAMSYEGESIPSYLLDAEGEFVVDPAVPEARAAVVWGLLEQAAWERAMNAEADDEDDEWYDEDASDDEEDEDDEDAFYDAMDIADLYLVEELED